VNYLVIFTLTTPDINQNKLHFLFIVRRVERVECGLPADQADLKPGDYVVFINKTNVVMMAEDDVMELIK